MTAGPTQPSGVDSQRLKVASDVAIENANTLIHELFAVGLKLASVAAMVQGAAADRLVEAIDGLDAVIWHIRTAIFAQLPAADTDVDDLSGDGADGGIGELIDQIGSLVGRIDSLATQTVAVKSTAVVGFLDAVHALHRARINLDADLDPPVRAASDTRLLTEPTDTIRHLYDDRDLAAARRDECAEARDREARSRDEAAGLRDMAADMRDEIHCNVETGSVAAPVGGDSRLLAGAANAMEAASRDRSASAADRNASALDRVAAKMDRHAAASDRAAARESLKEASLDGLTGAYVRRAGFRELERDVSRARRVGEPLTVLFVDVDRLKEVNDRDGHAAGDRLLREVAQALQEALRPHDLVIRYGGDEFVCAMAGMTRPEVVTRMATVSRTLAERIEGHGSVTFGLTELTAQDSVEALVARADRQFYEERDVRSSDG